MENEKNLDLSLGLPCRGGNSSPKPKQGNSSDNRPNKEDRDIKLINDFKTFLEGGNGTQHLTKVEGNLPNLGKAVMDSETSKNSITGRMWWANAEIEGEKRSSTNGKRKILFTEGSQQKKIELETKASHISLPTDEGSTADNEDVADSEMASSTSRQQGKDLHGGGQNGVEFLGQRRFTISSDKETMNKVRCLPYQGESSGEGSTMVAANFPAMFGNSALHLPTLDSDNSRGVGVHHQLIHLTQGEDDTEAHNSANQVKDSPLAPSSQPRTESITADFPAIKSGIAADVKFGGSGSAPNLPWVSTTGSGPNGRTISGVTYRFSPTQVKIVCACHGAHLSPDEFVRHASDENSSAADGLASFPGIAITTNNPSASAHS